jgi:hypothetical protein
MKSVNPMHRLAAPIPSSSTKASTLVRELSLEEQELQQKQIELEMLEARLAEKELELATFQAELHNFEREYLQVVGIRQQELQRIEAQIDEYTAYLESAHNFTPTAELKQIYRQLAKAIHPDLATEPEDRTRREQLMAEVNRAYEAGDIERLKAILTDWSLAEVDDWQDISVRLLHTIRKIAQSQQRLLRIERQVKELEKTDLYRLQLKSKHRKQRGRDLLVEMAQELDRQIQLAQQQLNELKSQMGGK